MVAQITQNGITYTGFDPQNNGKWIIETRSNWTYVNYQRDEFTKVIVGYVVEENGKYKAFDCGKTYTKYFDDLNSGIEFSKEKYLSEQK